MYLVFYWTIFGREEIQWLLINAGLGIFGIYAQIGWILGLFSKRIGDYPWYVHITPFLYYVLYTFLLRQFFIDITRSRENPRRRALVNNVYVVVSLLTYGWIISR